MEILHICDDFVVAIKPVGMDSEKAFPETLSRQVGGEIYPLHRLDTNVGGVMVYARTKQAAGTLSRAVQAGELEKEYVAMVHGIPPESGEWTDLLFKDSRRNKVFVVKSRRAGVREARLSYTRLSGDDPALVQIRLRTGRSHQIRVQFASRGFPLVGDHKYGSRSRETAPLLYSCRVAFPYAGKAYDFRHFPSWAPRREDLCDRPAQA